MPSSFRFRTKLAAVHGSVICAEFCCTGPWSVELFSNALFLAEKLFCRLRLVEWFSWKDLKTFFSYFVPLEAFWGSVVKLSSANIAIANFSRFLSVTSCFRLFLSRSYKCEISPDLHLLSFCCLAKIIISDWRNIICSVINTAIFYASRSWFQAGVDKTGVRRGCRRRNSSAYSTNNFASPMH